ncbi:M15 family metallopeptidase [Arenimonas sp.]|uniref:M15 family metallopeptidase n=1 Tax=Arenimonas sp. TaxID=1872635 RepID=UPI0039E558D3
MHSGQWRLLNGEFLEALPAAAANPRGNATARALSQAQWLIRRKSDGRFLALREGDTVRELQRGALTPSHRVDLAALAEADQATASPRELSGLIDRLHALGLDEADYAERTGLDLVAEPTRLSFAGWDRYARPLWLDDGASRAWRRMRDAARADGIALDAISGYRSHDYQLGIFRRKLARGQTVEQILSVNAAPGFSEHHGGRAMDIGTPGEPPAEESFEATPAFAWLREQANAFGFVMSYPHDNPHGIVYEPWHWRWTAGDR